MANVRAWDIPQRYLKLDLYQGRRGLKDTKLLSRLNVNYKISFQTSETVSGAVNELTLEIGGLTRDHMLYLATSYNQFTKNTIYNDIVLTAGYDRLNGIIFEGNVTEAIPQMDTADYSVRIKAVSWYEKMNNEIKSFAYEGEHPVNEVLQEIANEEKLLLQSQLPEDITVTDFTITNKNIVQTIRELANIKGIDVWSVNGRLFAKKRGEPIEDIKPFMIDKNNLVGTPTPTAIGCDVKIKLNPYVITGQKARIKSLRFPQLNTFDYFIQTMSHGGDTKGNKWQTNLHLVRSDIYVG